MFVGNLSQIKVFEVVADYDTNSIVWRTDGYAVVTSLKTMEHGDAGESAAIPWILATVVVFGSLLAAIWLRPTDEVQIPGYTSLQEQYVHDKRHA